MESIRVRVFTRVSGIGTASLGPRMEANCDESNTLFIIGNGPSRSETLNRHRSAIADNCSIAINDEMTDGLTPCLALREKYRENFSGLRFVQKNCPTFAHIPVRLPYESADAEYWKTLDVERSKLYSSIGTLSTRPDRAAEIFLWTVTSSFFRTIALGNQSSLLRALWLGMRFGYSDIILVGCDLITDDAYEKRKNAIQRNMLMPPLLDGELHSTAQLKRTAGQEQSLPDLIFAIASLASSQLGVAVRVANPESFLATKLGVFSS